MALQLPGVGVQSLQHHLGGAVADLAAGHMAILNGYDGVLRVIGLKVVPDPIIMVAKVILFFG